MLMRTDPFRELDRLTQQVLGTAIHPAVMPMDAWRDGDELMATAAVEGAADWHVFYAYRDIKDGDGHYVVLADAAYPTAGQAAHIARHSSPGLTATALTSIRPGSDRLTMVCTDISSSVRFERLAPERGLTILRFCPALR